ncbi:g426 [Coccomyxa elongata]
MLLMLVTAMCTEEDLPFFGALGGHCSQDGYAYVAIGLAASAFLTFPVALQLLKPRPAKTEDPPALEPPKGGDITEIIIEEEAPQKVAVEPTRVPTSPWSQQNEQHRRRGALTSGVSAPVGPATRAGNVSPFKSLNFQKAAEAMAWPADGPREARAFDRLTSFNARSAMLSYCIPEEEDATDKAPSPKDQAEAAKAQQNGVGGAKAAPDGGIYRREILPRLRQWQDSKVGKVVDTGLGWFNKLAPPPTIASMLGLLVGCVPVLKNLLFPAESAPLGFFTTALDTIANAFVFLISFILGAVLQKGPGPGTRSIGWGPIAMTLLNRWLFVPILGAVWVFGSHALGWWQSPDPLFTFIMLMTNAVPTGNQIQAVCAMFHTCEKECGSIMFWQYMFAVIGLPVWMALYLYLMGVFGFLL